MFRTSAEFIAKRNVSERVTRVIATLAEGPQHLTVVCIFEGAPSDDDREDCELTCGELLAEFPDIKTAETRCVSAADYSTDQDDHDAIVFLR